jgi:hypothetical protein
VTPGEPLPSPDEARAARLANAAPRIARLREAVRKAIAASSEGRDVWVDLPDGTGETAYETVRSELEARGWTVRRESSPENESFMVLSGGSIVSASAFAQNTTRRGAELTNESQTGAAGYASHAWRDIAGLLARQLRAHAEPSPCLRLSPENEAALRVYRTACRAADGEREAAPDEKEENDDA